MYAYYVQVFQLPGTTEQEQLIEQLEQRFHPHHFLPLEIKLDLARKLGREQSTCIILLSTIVYYALKPRETCIFGLATYESTLIRKRACQGNVEQSTAVLLTA